MIPDEVVQKDAINVKLLVTILEDGLPVDLSSCTQKNFIILKPGGTKLTKSSNFTTSGTDGKLQYFTISGDLSDVGEYQIQADLIFSGGYDGPTDIGSFWVASNL